MQNQTSSVPTISIVTVVYNGVSHIVETMKSVYAQTYKNYEYIIIDGKSTDGTCALIQQNIDSNTIFISEPDKGVYDAMNKATRLASGEWIYYLNCGDTFFNSRVLEDIFSHEYQSDVGIIVGDILNEKNIEGTKFYLRERPKCLKSDPTFVLPACHQAIFTRMPFAKKYPFELQYKICADFNFFKTLFHKEAIRYEYNNVVIAKYDLSGISTTNTVLAMKETSKIRNLPPPPDT